MSKLTTALEGEKEKMEKIIKENLWGICCKQCGGGGGNGVLGDGFVNCNECSGTGITDWKIEPLTSEITASNARILSTVLEWARENMMAYTEVREDLKDNECVKANVVGRVDGNNAILHDLSQFLQEATAATKKEKILNLKEVITSINAETGEITVENLTNNT